jgi:hypothetical protein
MIKPIKQISLILAVIAVAQFMISCSMQRSVSSGTSFKLSTEVAKKGTPKLDVQQNASNITIAQDAQVQSPVSSKVSTPSTLAMTNNCISQMHKKLPGFVKKQAMKKTANVVAAISAVVNKNIRPASVTTSTMIDNLKGLLGFIFGALAIITMWFLPIVPLLFAIAGLVLSILGMHADSGKGWAIAGLVLSILSLVLYLIVIVLIAALL